MTAETEALDVAVGDVKSLVFDQEQTINRLTAQNTSLDETLRAYQKQVVELQDLLGAANADKAVLVAKVAVLQAQLDALKPKVPYLVGSAVTARSGVTVASRESYYGTTFMGFRDYFGIGRGKDTAMETAAADHFAHGREPHFSFKVPGNDWVGAATGKYDAWVRARFAAMRAAAVKAGPDERAKVTCHHEPDDEIVNGGYKTMEPKFIAMQKHFANLANDYDRIDYGVCLMTWHVFSKGDLKITDLVPPELAALLDFIAFDGYEIHGTIKAPATTPNKNWTNFDLLFGQIRAFVDQYMPGRPWYLWETGCWEAAVQAKPDWFETQHQLMVKHGGSGWFYFDSHIGDVGGWGLDGQRLVRYKEQLVGARSAA